MDFAELEALYGTAVALRIQGDLHPHEFAEIGMTHLLKILHERVESGRRDYTEHRDNPFINGELGVAREEYLLLLRTRCEEAEDLYLLVCEQEKKRQSGQTSRN